MKLLGITGGVGMGKSACTQLLRGRGIPVVDTDELAREVVEPGQPALLELQQLFGSDILDSDGRLRRDLLARQVFDDANLRKKLEAILHPRIRQLWRAQADSWRSTGHRLGAVAIPLLFETKAEAELDVVICVACTRPSQWQRLQARGWPDEQIAQRLQAQWSIEEKMARADYVIWTEASLEIHAAQLDRILLGL